MTILDLTNLSTSRSHLEAFIATMPVDPDVDLKEISFRGPNTIAIHDDLKFRARFRTSIPFFDYQKGKIVWTAFVDGLNDDQEWYNQNFDIWHIGSHFTLDLVDKTKFYCEKNPSFLVLQGGSLHLNFAEGNVI
jgi:hypothetical protein